MFCFHIGLINFRETMYSQRIFKIRIYLRHRYFLPILPLHFEAGACLGCRLFQPRDSLDEPFCRLRALGLLFQCSSVFLTARLYQTGAT